MSHPNDPNGPYGAPAHNPYQGQGNPAGPQPETDGETEVVNIPGQQSAPPTAFPPGAGTPPAATPTPPPGYSPPAGDPQAGFTAPPNAGQYNPTQVSPVAQPYAAPGQQPYGAPAPAPGYGAPGQQPYGAAPTPGYPSQPGAAPGTAGYAGPGQQPYGQQPAGYGSAPGTTAFGDPGQQSSPYGQPGSAPVGAYGQAPGADPFAPMAGTPAKKGPWKALIAVGGVLVIAAIAVIVTGWLWWWPRELDQSAAESGVSKVLTEEYQATDVADVNCPSGQRIKTGNSFECTVTVGGQQQKVTVTFLDDEGRYEVARPTS